MPLSHIADSLSTLHLQDDTSSPRKAAGQSLSSGSLSSLGSGRLGGGGVLKRNSSGSLNTLSGSSLRQPSRRLGARPQALLAEALPLPPLAEQQQIPFEQVRAGWLCHVSLLICRSKRLVVPSRCLCACGAGFLTAR